MERATIDILADELLSRIFESIPTIARIRLSHVCKHWRNVALDPHSWPGLPPTLDHHRAFEFLILREAWHSETLIQTRIPFPIQTYAHFGAVSHEKQLFVHGFRALAPKSDQDNYALHGFDLITRQKLFEWTPSLSINMQVCLPLFITSTHVIIFNRTPLQETKITFLKMTKVKGCKKLTNTLKQDKVVSLNSDNISLNPIHAGIAGDKLWVASQHRLFGLYRRTRATHMSSFTLEGDPVTSEEIIPDSISETEGTELNSAEWVGAKISGNYIVTLVKYHVRQRNGRSVTEIELRVRSAKNNFKPTTKDKWSSSKYEDANVYETSYQWDIEWNEESDLLVVRGNREIRFYSLTDARQKPHVENFSSDFGCRSGYSSPRIAIIQNHVFLCGGLFTAGTLSVFTVTVTREEQSLIVRQREVELEGKKERQKKFKIFGLWGSEKVGSLILVEENALKMCSLPESLWKGNMQKGENKVVMTEKSVSYEVQYLAPRGDIGRRVGFVGFWADESGVWTLHEKGFDEVRPKGIPEQ